MPYASQRDREPHDLELRDPDFPVAPLNLFLTSGYQAGVFDLCWDEPSNSAANEKFDIVGVNVYRSFDSEFGPYDRITELPVGARFWQDRTDNVVVLDEIVEDAQWVLRGRNTGTEAEGVRYVFRTQHCPIVTAASQAVPDWSVDNVIVTIDGVRARVRRVIGETGEIELETYQFPEVATQSLSASPIPGDNSVVKVSYRYNRSLLKTNLGTRVFYRVTTVGYRIDPEEPEAQQVLRETPLERAAFTSSRELEKLDWIWREGVRRNRWILQMGGERVKLLIRKTTGPVCGCVSATYKHPLGDCLYCYGTGILGGYEGPYDIIIAPDDAERRISQGARGRYTEHVIDVWTGPSPLLAQRDFVVRVNGERFSVGPTRMPSNRGMVLQQHFNIGFIDEQDIRYKVPLDGVRRANDVSQVRPPHFAPAEITDKPNIPDDRELRGRTKVWENTTYALPFFFLLQELVHGAWPWVL